MKKRKKKVCIDCKGPSSSKNKLTPRCMKCEAIRKRNPVPLAQRQREWTLIKKYNLDNDAFDCLWFACHGKCGICKQNLIMPISAVGQPRNAAVIDHNHTTGNLRGLLCNSCNTGIGLLNDSYEIVREALKWLTPIEN